MSRGGTRRFAVVAAVAAVMALTGPAAAAAPAADPTAPVPTATSDDLGTDPVLDDVPVDASATTRAAEERYTEARAAQRAALDAQREAARERDHLADDAVTAAAVQARVESDLDAARSAEDATRAELARRKATERRAAAAFDAERRDLRRLAAAVVTASTSDRYAVFAAGDDASRYERRDAVKVRSIDQQSARTEDKRRPWRRARRVRRTQEAVVSIATAETARTKQRLDDAVRARVDLERRAADAGTESDRRQAAVDAAKNATTGAAMVRRASRLTARVTGLDLPLVAVDAYWRAAGNAPCALPWWLLAGIGRTESHHGTAQGSSLDAAGTTTKHILGIVLDGRPGVGAIRDSDGGRLDDNAVWDRAVGPMQFIPSTWARWAADDNQDGLANPHNLYDAAGAAANYLCYGRPSLTDELAQRGALYAYNRSVPYANKVLASGHEYQAALAIPDASPPTPPVP